MGSNAVLPAEGSRDPPGNFSSCKDAAGRKTDRKDGCPSVGGQRKYRLVFFDLDGTLTDSGRGIIACVRRTAEHMGCPELPPDVLRRFIGPPTWDSFSTFCRLSPERTKEAVRYFRSVYDEGGVFDSSVYGGIPELLDDLRGAGAALAVATSKPRSQAYKVLDHFGLTQKFDYVAAASESDKDSAKELLIRSVLKESGIAPEEAVMIGDTRYDTAGARKAGVDFIGVLYGFGTREEMRREGGTVFARTVESLYAKLLDKRRAAIL